MHHAHDARPSTVLTVRAVGPLMISTSGPIRSIERGAVGWDTKRGPLKAGDRLMPDPDTGTGYWLRVGDYAA